MDADGGLLAQSAELVARVSELEAAAYAYLTAEGGRDLHAVRLARGDLVELLDRKDRSSMDLDEILDEVVAAAKHGRCLPSFEAVDVAKLAHELDRLRARVAELEAADPHTCTYARIY